MSCPVTVIIPARYGSTRLPGKPLADIGGRALVVRVAEGASVSGARVVVATDDARISAVVERAGFECVMTSTDAPSGTARTAEAWRILGRPQGRIVNLQGDEPMASGAWIEAVTSVPPADDLVVTLARRADKAEAEEPSCVKVVLDDRGHAMYFSRRQIPWGAEEWLQHLGVYCFSPTALEAVVALPESAPARAERLEQLSWMSAGFRIRVVTGDFPGIGVDTPEDLERCRRVFQ